MDMNDIVHVHDLYGEAVFVERDAFDLLSVRGDCFYSLVFLRKFLGSLCQSPGQTSTGIAYRVNHGFACPRFAHTAQIRAEPSALTLDHVAKRTVGIAIKEIFAA